MDGQEDRSKEEVDMNEEESNEKENIIQGLEARYPKCGLLLYACKYCGAERRGIALEEIAEVLENLAERGPREMEKMVRRFVAGDIVEIIIQTIIDACTRVEKSPQELSHSNHINTWRRSALAASRCLVHVIDLKDDTAIHAASAIIRFCEFEDRIEDDPSIPTAIWRKLIAVSIKKYTLHLENNADILVEPLATLVRSDDIITQDLAAQALHILASVRGGYKAGTANIEAPPIISLFRAATSDQARQALAETMAALLLAESDDCHSAHVPHSLSGIRKLKNNHLVWLALDAKHEDYTKDSTTTHTDSQSKSRTKNRKLRKNKKPAPYQTLEKKEIALASAEPAARILTSTKTIDHAEPLYWLLANAIKIGGIEAEAAIQEAAAISLERLAVHGIVMNTKPVGGSLPDIIDRGASFHTKAACARAVAALATNDHMVRFDLIARTLSPLVRMLNSCPFDDCREAAAIAIKSLILNTDNAALNDETASLDPRQKSQVLASLTRLIYLGCTDTAEAVAAEILATVAKTSKILRLQLVETGGITPLLRLVKFGETKEVRSNAAAALHLLIDDADTCPDVQRDLLESGSAEEKVILQLIAATSTSPTTSATAPEHRTMLPASSTATSSNNGTERLSYLQGGSPLSARVTGSTSTTPRTSAIKFFVCCSVCKPTSPEDILHDAIDSLQHSVPMGDERETPASHRRGHLPYFPHTAATFGNRTNNQAHPRTLQDDLVSAVSLSPPPSPTSDSTYY